MAERKPEAERKAEEVAREETRRNLATENLVELEAREAEARRKAEAQREAAKEVKTVSVMVRAKEPGFNVGHRRAGEIFSYESARVGDDGNPVLPSWVELLSTEELAELQAKEGGEAQYPADYRLSLGQSSSAPPTGAKPTQMRNPADGVKTGEPQTLSEAGKALYPSSNAGEGSLAKGASDLV